MMDYEPITQELREYIRDNTPRNGNCWWQPEDTKAVIACCDSIDAIHRLLEAENERLRNESERGDDWIKLPVDADGVPIRVGDVMECISNGKKRQLSVDECRYRSDGWHVSLMVETCIRQEYMPNELHHYVPDTWESIIHDAMQAGGNITENTPPLVARCKALCERTREVTQ